MFIISLHTHSLLISASSLHCRHFFCGACHRRSLPFAAVHSPVRHLFVAVFATSPVTTSNVTVALLSCSSASSISSYVSLLSNHVHIEGLFVKVLLWSLISGKGIRFCAKVTSTKLEELKKLDSESTLLHESKKAKSIPLPPLSNASEIDSRKRRATGPLEKTFNMNARETLDLHIARMFFSSGLPFHLAKNPYFVKAFSYAANNYIDGYIPPEYNKLRTTLLEKEKQHVERMLEPTKNSWSGKGASIVSDG
ncbi:hypothetical protein S83_056427 [Arachis hypogaea]